LGGWAGRSRSKLAPDRFDPIHRWFGDATGMGGTPSRLPLVRDSMASRHSSRLWGKLRWFLRQLKQELLREFDQLEILITEQALKIH
jgi:hypothetical protein